MLVKEQRKILRYIARHENLKDILQKYNVDYYTLQNKISEKNASIYIKFSNYKFDDSTKVTLTPRAKAELEEFRQLFFQIWGTNIIALISLIVAIIDLFW